MKTINKIILILLIVIFMSCTRSKKPFVIISKYDYETVKGIDDIIFCRYNYIDATNNVHAFYELYDKYNVGDTIK